LPVGNADQRTPAAATAAESLRAQGESGCRGPKRLICGFSTRTDLHGTRAWRSARSDEYGDRIRRRSDRQTWPARANGRASTRQYLNGSRRDWDAGKLLRQISVDAVTRMLPPTPTVSRRWCAADPGSVVPAAVHRQRPAPRREQKRSYLARVSASQTAEPITDRRREARDQTPCPPAPEKERQHTPGQAARGAVPSSPPHDHD